MSIPNTSSADLVSTTWTAVASAMIDSAPALTTIRLNASNSLLIRSVTALRTIVESTLTATSRSVCKRSLNSANVLRVVSSNTRIVLTLSRTATIVLLAMVLVSKAMCSALLATEPILSRIAGSNAAPVAITNTSQALISLISNAPSITPFASTLAQVPLGLTAGTM